MSKSLVEPDHASSTEPSAVDLLPSLKSLGEGAREAIKFENREDWDRYIISASFATTFKRIKNGPDFDAPPDPLDRLVNPRQVQLTSDERAEYATHLLAANREIRDARVALELERYQAFLETIAAPPVLTPEAKSYTIEHVKNGTFDMTAYTKAAGAFELALVAEAGGWDNYYSICGTAFFPPDKRPKTLEEWFAQADENGELPRHRNALYIITRQAHPKAFLARDHLRDLESRRLELARAFIDGLRR